MTDSAKMANQRQQQVNEEKDDDEAYSSSSSRRARVEVTLKGDQTNKLQWRNAVLDMLGCLGITNTWQTFSGKKEIVLACTNRDTDNQAHNEMISAMMSIYPNVNSADSAKDKWNELIKEEETKQGPNAADEDMIHKTVAIHTINKIEPVWQRKVYMQNYVFFDPYEKDGKIESRKKHATRCAAWAAILKSIPNYLKVDLVRGDIPHLFNKVFAQQRKTNKSFSQHMEDVRGIRKQEFTLIETIKEKFEIAEESVMIDHGTTFSELFLREQFERAISADPLYTQQVIAMKSDPKLANASLDRKSTRLNSSHSSVSRMPSSA